jgi:hypothetical protein
MDRHGRDEDPTRRMGGTGADEDPTRQMGGAGADPDPTQRIDPVEGFEAETPLREPDTLHARSDATGDAHQSDVDRQDAETSGRGREIAIAAIGAVIGFVIAFLVVALGTSDDGDDAQLAAAQEEIEELEAGVEERDATIGELEARLSEAEAAAGARADDVEAQRDALDERASILDEREAALRERADALDERERELDQREQDASTESPGPGIDEETAEGIVDRVVEQIRDLFQRE